MNFLAHALLSPPDDDVLTGNVCADFIKGVALSALPPAIAKGVRLHRAIDVLADRHPAFVEAHGFIARHRRRYAPVLLDVFFDHCLARNWRRYHPQPLERFAETVCAALEPRIGTLPIREGDRLRRMVESRWLDVYATEAGVQRVLAGLNRRARFSDVLDRSHADLAAHRDEMDAMLGPILTDLRAELAEHLGA